MIEKKRLEELIEQKAKIYSTHWHEEVDLSLPCEISEVEYDDKTITRLVVFEDEEHAPSYMLDGLIEDIEGAKWEEEFGCIERTERLELPTWEELQTKIQGSVGFVEIVYNYRIILEIEVSYITKSRVYVSCKEDIGYSEVYKAELTKENYALACRKAKELFLGNAQ